MAKGQRRGNRELKKPKQDKPATAAASTASSWATVDKLRAKDDPPRKK